MKKPCDPGFESDEIFEKIIGFGEKSIHKSYYPELQEKICNLKKTEEELRRIKDELEIRVTERTSELEAARAELFEQNRLLERKVMERTEELLIAKEKAEEASRAKTLFLKNMSHELRTPLNGIMGFSDMLTVSDLNEQQAEFNKIIKSSSVNLLGLINDMFDISELENNKIRLEREPFKLQKAVFATLDMIRCQAENKNIKLICEISDEINYDLVGDRCRLEQILLNLLSNAVKFTPGGKIKLSVSQLFKCNNQCRLEFIVFDEGIGIPSDKICEIFEMFHQLDESSTKRHGGAGIGLAIVKGLTDLMQGDIFVNSEIGKGSTFTVKLPFEICHDEMTAAVQTGKRAADPGREIRLLLAEDENTNILLISAMAEYYNWKISVAHNGLEAVELFKNIKFDAVLMDIQMPIMDGIEASCVIRKFEFDSGQERTPIIALTAYASPEDRDALMAANMDDYIAKPVLSHEAFKKALARYLR